MVGVFAVVDAAAWWSGGASTTSLFILAWTIGLAVAWRQLVSETVR